MSQWTIYEKVHTNAKVYLEEEVEAQIYVLLDWARDGGLAAELQ